MPTYDFKCKQVPCSHTFEEIQPISAPNPKCPKCGEETEKVPSFRGNVIGMTPKFYPNRG